jgi:hypothetical protein
MTTAGDWIREHGQEFEPARGFLLPYLQYGPNNQYMQLMEAAVAAKALGRSLLMPHFLSWVNDETGSAGRASSFADTFDVDAVSRFVSLEPIQQAQQHTLVSLSEYKDKKLSQFLSLQRIPCCPRRQKFRKGTTVASEAQIQGLVRQTRLLAAPTIGWYSFFSVDRVLMLQAARHFLRAPKVRQRAQTISQRLFGGEPYVAVHLRREATEIGCSRGAPSVLCPLSGPEYTLDTQQARTFSGAHQVVAAGGHAPRVKRPLGRAEVVRHGRRQVGAVAAHSEIAGGLARGPLTTAPPRAGTG